ncbi:MAG TPA: hypothetical protein VKA46_24075 [Gemmataceae bacterium]|nr:hypothetical protein [Gemmataceae bacterium]
MADVKCKVKPGLASFERGVAVTDIDGRPEFLRVNADFLTYENGQAYLPIGVVYRLADRVLIELPHEADSGTHRLWVDPASISW